MVLGVALLAAGALALRGRTPVPSAEVTALAGALRALYAEPGGPGERWGQRPPPIRLPDGRSVPRAQAHRDDPKFVDAAASLLKSPAGDDAALGAWLLGSAPPERHEEAARALVPVLGHGDPLAALEAARALGAIGGPPAAGALRALAVASPPPAADPVPAVTLRTGAAWAVERIRERHRDVDPAPAPAGRLPPGFHRGVNWWFEGEEADAGAASFRTLRTQGVGWVSLHSWDPLQASIHDPVFADRSRHFGIPNLSGLVRSAHAAGLKVMVKPHLEMSHRRATPEERRVLRGTDEEAKRKLRERFEAERAAQGWHNDIEMRTEADWQTWFRNYEGYLLEYARQAQEAGADMFCVGRELDRSVLRREKDWRRLIARVREVFRGPLVYSANFDSYEPLGFWDALDYIGVSAYFSLSADEEPDLAALAAGWDRALEPLAERSRRFGKPVLFTEVGFASVAGAARTPWRPPSGPARPWLQARCYEAALRAVAGRPWIQGTFWWLWEGVTQPPFRDDSYTIQGKPAALLMAAWYH
jgi:hypothetical protein